MQKRTYFILIGGFVIFAAIIAAYFVPIGSRKIMCPHGQLRYSVLLGETEKYNNVRDSVYGPGDELCVSLDINLYLL